MHFPIPDIKYVFIYNEYKEKQNLIGTGISMLNSRLKHAELHFLERFNSKKKNSNKQKQKAVFVYNF